MSSKIRFRHRLAAAFAGGAAAWLYAICPRPPFLRRFQSASLVPSEAQKDNAPLVPNTPFAHRGLHDTGSGYPATGGLDHQLSTYCTVARSLARQAGYGKNAPQGAPIAPENTLPAFEAACRAGYGIELDLQLTREGRVVVFHDDSLVRAAGMRGTIGDFSYEQLCRIPLFSPPVRFGTAGFQGERRADTSGGAGQALATWQQHVPLFSDVLKLVDGRVPLIVEYKARGTRVPEKLLETGDRLLRAYHGPYVVESFDPKAMGWYRKHDPRVIRGQLAGRGALSLLAPGAPAGAVRVTDTLGGALLADCVSRPDFLAMDWHLWDSVAGALAARMGAQRVAWTVRSNEEALQCVDRFDRIIFEGFIPQWGVFGRIRRDRS